MADQPLEVFIIDESPRVKRARLYLLYSSLVLICFLMPFDNLLMVTDHSGYQTVQQLVLVGTKIAVAAPLLPVFGIEGAAAGTVAGIAVMLFSPGGCWGETS